jgi:hypothetical protein
MQLLNEVTLITLVTELQTGFFVTLIRSGRDVVLRKNSNKFHRTGKSMSFKEFTDNLELKRILLTVPK